MNDPTGLPQLKNRRWDLVILDGGEVDDLNGQLWAIVDQHDQCTRAILSSNKAHVTNLPTQLLLAAISEPLPPCSPARPSSLGLPGAPHDMRRHTLSASERAALFWTLRTLDIELVDNDELNDLLAMTLMIKLFSTGGTPGVFTGTAFYEEDLCRAALRVLHHHPWTTLHPDDAILLSTTEAHRASLSHTLVTTRNTQSPGIVLYPNLHEARAMFDAAQDATEPEFVLAFNMLAAFFDPIESIDLTTIDHLRQRNLIPDDATHLPCFRRVEPEDLDNTHTPRSAYALLLALEALAAFLDEHSPISDGKTLAHRTGTYTVADGVTITVESRPDLKI